MDLFYPEMAVQLGSYCFQAGVQLEVVSCQDSSYDWAKVCFTEQLGEAVTLARMDEVVISLGYDGELQPVFEGYVVNDFTLSESTNELLCKDAAIKLEEVFINNTFTDVQPSEVIEYCCLLAELPAKLSAAQYQQRNLPVFGVSALQVVAGVGSTWGITPLMYCRNGILHWDTPPDQTKLYIFEYAKNVIALTKDAGYWCLETVSTPFIRHSDQFGLQHPTLTGTFTVYKVVFSSTSEGFLRTLIYFKEGDHANA